MLIIAVVLLLIVLGVVSVEIFRSLVDGGLKEFFLEHTDQTTGYYMSLGAALATIMGSTLIAAFAGFWLVGLILGLFLGAFAGTWVWNEGLQRVPPKYRGLPLWRGARQKDSADPCKANHYERSEGLCWGFPGFFGLENTDMQERPYIVKGIPIETKDSTVVPTDVTIQYAPESGFLYEYGNVKRLEESFEAEAREDVRAFGIAMDDLDHLIEVQPSEKLKELLCDSLNRRARGEINTTVIDSDGKATFTPVQPAQQPIPWGIHIKSAALTNFQLPKTVTEAAAAVKEAEHRRKAADTIRDTITEFTDRFKERGVDANAAAAIAASTVTPENPQPIQTFNLTGLEGPAKILANTVLTAMGKTPLPPEPTQPSATQPQGGSK